jgi:hypothetical protein
MCIQARMTATRCDEGKWGSGKHKSHCGRVFKTDSIPRTPDRSAEHFIAVVFGRSNFLEAAFARFKLVDGIRCSIVYSHRIYREKVGDQMSKWLNVSFNFISAGIVFTTSSGIRGNR